MQLSFYSEKVTNYLYKMPNVGTLDVDNKTVFMAEHGSINDKSKIQLFIEINDSIIKNFKYLVYGDGYIIASLGKLSEDIIGTKMTKLSSYSINNLAGFLDIPTAKTNNLKIIKQALDNLIIQYNNRDKMV